MQKNIFLTFIPILFVSSSLFLVACGQNNSDLKEKTEEISTKTSEPLTQGNMFDIARDVAEMQLKTNQYLSNLLETQTKIETALNQNDTVSLNQGLQSLESQLNGLNTALVSLNLKSQEIDEIRTHLLENSKKLLDAPFLTEKVDLSNENIDEIKEQIEKIKNEMFTLSAMLKPKQNSE